LQRCAQAAAKMRIVFMRDDESEQHSFLTLAAHRDRRSGDIGHAAKHILDFRRLDALATDLHLAIATADDVQDRIPIKASEIAGRRHPSDFVGPLQTRAAGLALSVFPFPQRDVAAPDDELADLAGATELPASTNAYCCPGCKYPTGTAPSPLG
jgi:hypothetical protein